MIPNEWVETKHLIYQFSSIFCSYACGHAIVIAESLQEAMEAVIKSEARPGEEEMAVKLFRQWQKGGPAAGLEVPTLWERIMDEDNREVFSVTETNLFRCEGND